MPAGRAFLRLVIRKPDSVPILPAETGKASGSHLSGTKIALRLLRHSCLASGATADSRGHHAELAEFLPCQSAFVPRFSAVLSETRRARPCTQ